MIALFDWPDWYDGPRTAKQATILRRFLAWVDANPAVVDAIVTGARALLQRGDRASGSRVWEHVRAHSPASGGDHFKLCNNFRSLAVRLVMHTHPDLAGRIPVRSLCSRGRVAGTSIGIDDDLASLDDDAEIERLEQRIDAIKARRNGGGEPR